MSNNYNLTIAGNTSGLQAAAAQGTAAVNLLSNAASSAQQRVTTAATATASAQQRATASTTATTSAVVAQGSAVARTTAATTAATAAVRQNTSASTASSAATTASTAAQRVHVSTTTAFATVARAATTATRAFTAATQAGLRTISGAASAIAAQTQRLIALNTQQHQTSAGAGLLSRSWQSLRGDLVALTISAVGLYAIIGQIGAGLTAVQDYSTNLSKAQAVTQATAAQMVSLDEIAKRLGRETAFSAAQAASAEAAFGQAGFKVNEILSALPGTLDLAAAGQLDLAEAAGITGNILHAFRLEASQAPQVVDALALAAARSNTNVTQLGEAMSYVGPVAGTLRLAVSDTSAALGILSNAGIQSSMAGTALRGILADLVSPTGEASKVFKKLGLEIEDLNPSTHSLVDIVDRFAEALPRLGDEGAQAGGAFEIFGQRAAPAMLALVSQRAGLRQLTDELRNSGGAAKNMAQIMLDNVGGSLTILQSAIEGVRIDFGEGATPAIREAAGALTEFFANGQDTARAFGAAVGGALLGVTNLFIGLVEHAALVKFALLALVVAFAAIKLAPLILQGITYTATLISLAASQGVAAVATNELALAWTRLTAAMATNPITVIAVALAALVGVIGLVVDRHNQAEKAAEAYYDRLRFGGSEISAQIHAHVGLAEAMDREREARSRLTIQAISDAKKMAALEPVLERMRAALDAGDKSGFAAAAKDAEKLGVSLRNLDKGSNSLHQVSLEMAALKAGAAAAASGIERANGIIDQSNAQVAARAQEFFKAELDLRRDQRAAIADLDLAAAQARIRIDQLSQVQSTGRGNGFLLAELARLDELKAKAEAAAEALAATTDRLIALTAGAARYGAEIPEIMRQIEELFSAGNLKAGEALVNMIPDDLFTPMFDQTKAQFLAMQRGIAEISKKYEDAFTAAAAAAKRLTEEQEKQLKHLNSTLESLGKEASALDTLSAEILKGNEARAQGERAAEIERRYRAEAARLTDLNADALARLRNAIAQVVDAERRLETSKNIATLREETAARLAAVAAYQLSAQAGADEKESVQDQIELSHLLAKALDDQRGAVLEAFAAAVASRKELARSDVSAQLKAETAALNEMLEAFGKGPAAVEALTIAQEDAAEKLAILSKVAKEHRAEIELDIIAWQKLKRETQVKTELSTAQRELDLLRAKASIRRQDYSSIELYRRALENVTFEMELQAQIAKLRALGATPAEIQSMRDLAEEARNLNRAIDDRDTETAWQAGVAALTGTLRDGLIDAGKTAIEGWVEFGNSWVDNLLEKMVEAFASAALQSAITGAFSNNGNGGFWSSVVSAFSGGGDTGSNSGGGWISTLASAYSAWKQGASLWSALSGTSGITTVAGTNGISASFATTQTSGGFTATAGASPSAAGTGSSLATSVTMGLVAAAVVYAMDAILTNQTAHDYIGQQAFFLSDGRIPGSPATPVAPPGTPGYGTGGGTGGSGNGDGMQITLAKATAQVDEYRKIIGTAGGLALQIGYDGVKKIQQAVSDSTIGLVEKYGGAVKSLQAFSLEVRRDGDRFKATAGTWSQSFKTMEEALAGGIEKMLSGGEFENLSTSVNAVFKNADKIGLASLDQALALAQAADNALAGIGISVSGVVTPAVTEFEQQMQALKAEIEATTAQGLKWGISLDALNALGEQQIKQLERMQDAAAGEQIGKTLDALFAVSPQAAADAELAGMRIEVNGIIALANLEREYQSLVLIGRLSDVQLAKIRAYIDAAEAAGPAAAGQAAANYNGGGSGVQDSGASQRDSRRAELWQILRDLENGGAAAAGSLAEALNKAQGLADEMRDLNMGEIYAQKMQDLATLAAGAEFMQPFEAIIANAGVGDAAAKWAELGARYGQFEADLMAGAERLKAAGFDVADALAKLRQAQQVEAEAMGRDLLASFGDPMIKARGDAKDLGDRLRLLAEMAAAGAVSVEDAAQALQYVGNQAFLSLADGLLGMLDKYYDDYEDKEGIRLQAAQLRFDMELAQWRYQLQLYELAGVLTAEQVAQFRAAIDYMETHPPDLSGITRPPPATTTTASTGLDQAYSRIDDIIKQWTRAPWGELRRQARELVDTLADVRKEAREAGTPLARLANLEAAYRIQRGQMINDWLRDSERLNLTDWQRQTLDITERFADMRAALAELGGTAAEFARIDRGEAAEMANLRRSAGQAFRDFVAQLRQEDPRLNSQESYNATKAEFERLTALARGGDLDAISRLGEAAQNYYGAAQGYLGQFGAAGLIDQFGNLERELGLSLESSADPVVSEVSRGNLILGQIRDALVVTRPPQAANDTATTRPHAVVVANDNTARQRNVATASPAVIVSTPIVQPRPSTDYAFEARREAPVAQRGDTGADRQALDALQAIAQRVEQVEQRLVTEGDRQARLALARHEDAQRTRREHIKVVRGSNGKGGAQRPALRPGEIRR